MPHFPRFAAQQQSPMDLATLLSLLTDSHPHSQSPAQKESAKHSYHHQRASTFSPKFDVYETSKDYVLEGELPGLQDKKKIEIEFTDPQTLVVRGKIEKIVEENKAPAAPAPAPAAETHAVEEKPQVAEDKEVKRQEEEKPVSRPHTPPRPVTVEDSPDEDDVDYEAARKSTKMSRSSSVTSATTTTTTATETDKQSTDSTLEDLIRSQLKKKQQLEKQKQEQLLKQKQEQQLKAQQQQQQQKPQQPQVRYWVSERTIGSFQRTFNFPGFIDQDRVSAKLENGILTVVVPKRAKAAIKRVEIL